MKFILIILMLSSIPVIPVQASELTAPAVTGEAASRMPEETENFGTALQGLLSNVLRTLRPDLKEAAAICLGLMATVVLVSIVQSFGEGTKKSVNLAGAAAISASLLMSANSMIRLGSDTVRELCDYGKLLLPVMTGALAAQGAGTASAALYTGSALFIALLSGLIAKVLIPMVYLFLGLIVANSATGEAMLKRMADLLKWILNWCLKTIVAVFTGYLSITGIVSGATDATVLKAAKTAISTAVPVVGGALSNAAESVLAGAALMKNAAGIYGIVAVLAIFLEPFLRIGIHYLMLKLTTAIKGIFGWKEMTDLIGSFSEAMGFLLAMTGSVCILLLISTVCFLKGVG